MLIVLTRPDDTPVAINPDDVVQLAPVPVSGPLVGPLTKGARIVFRNDTHQDVKELFDDVVARINASRAGAVPRLAVAAKTTKRARAST